MKLRYYLILFSVLVCSSNMNAQTVSISSSAPSNTICSGTNVTFTANISGFTNPYYQWYANGTAISGATSSTYSSTSLVNGDQVNVKVNEGPFGGEITSNGLLLNLDATNSSSYPGSGTTWNNLVTGNEVTNFTIQSGGSYSTVNGGVIRFGNSRIGAGASSSTGFSNLSAYTVEVWVKPAGTMGDYDPSVEVNTNYTPSFFAEKVYNSGAGNRVNMVLAYNARGLTSGTANNSYRYEAAINNGSWKKHQIATNYASDLNNWVQIVSTYDGSKLTIYRNGVSLGSSAALGITSLRTPSIGYWIAHRWDMNDGVYGDYSKVMMYNKALTTTEVTANYNAFNARFVSSGVSSSSITITINPATVPTITVNGDGCINKTSLTTTSGLTSYVWYKDNVIISGITTNALIPNAIGDYKVVVSNGSCSNTSSATTIYNCGINADGKAVSIANTGSLISREGGAYLGTAKDITGKIFNTTSLTTLAATTIGSTSAILGGVITGTNGRSSATGVVYSTDPNFGTFLTTSISTNVAAGTYTSTITGLTSSTKYYAKSFIVNASGTNYGSAVDFTTTVAPAVPASFSFSTSNLSGNLPNYYLATNNLTLSQLPTSWSVQWTYRLDESIPSADGMHWFFSSPGTAGKYYTDMHLYQLNGSLQFWYNKNNYTSTETIMTGLSQNTVYKIAITYDGTNLRTYSNGSLISTNAINITVKPTNSTLKMGSNVARTIDEFRIWDSALSQAQIAANQGISVIGSTGLMLYYNFNEGIAGANNTGITSITDQSGNNRNGVFTNTALTGTVNNFVNSIITGY